MNMQWIALAEELTATGIVEMWQWDVADQFRTNSGLKNWGFSATVPGWNQYFEWSEGGIQPMQPLDIQSQNLRRTLEMLLPCLLMGHVGIPERGLSV